MKNKTNFQNRNQQLIGALLTSPKTPIQVLASIIFEQTTSRELSRETDPEYGKEYLYKSGPEEYIVSLRVHPDVADFFNWHSPLLAPRDENSLADSLFIRQKKEYETNTHIANVLKKEFSRYQRDNKAAISYNKKRLAKNLNALIGSPLQDSSLPIISEACEAIGVAFNEPLAAILTDDDIEICGRVDDTYYFDVTQRHQKGWHALVQIRGECKNITAYYPSKYEAFLRGLIYLLPNQIA